MSEDTSRVPRGPSADAPTSRPSRSDGSFFNSEELLDCELGDSIANASECLYLADGLCYASLDEACACVCPRSRNSTCVAGLFENEFGAVDVNCN